MPLFKTSGFIFIILAIATFVSHAWIDPYEQTGAELLTGGWKFRSAGNSRIDIAGNGLILFSGDAETGVSAYQDLPGVKAGTLVLVSAEVKCTDVIAGEKPWNLARLQLVQNDGKKDRWDLPHIVVGLTGTQDWKNYRKAFTVSPETQRIRFVAQLSRSTGSLQIKNSHLYPVRENPQFKWARDISLFAWGAFFLLLLGSFLFMVRKNIFFRLLLIATFISIIAGTTLPGGIKDRISAEVITQIDAESKPFKAVIPWDLSKVWHACSFFLFGSLLYLMMEKKSILRMVTLILMLAGSTEIMQLYIDGRSPLLSDFFIDAAGGIAGTILIGFLRMNHNNAAHPEG